MIPLLVSGHSVLVFDVAHVKALREAGIVGVLVGSLPKAPQQNVFLGLPLQLSAYEALWLVEAGMAVLLDAAKHSQWLARPDASPVVTLSRSVQYAITLDTHQPKEPGSRCLDAEIAPGDFLRRVSKAGGTRDFMSTYRAFKYLRDRDFFLMPGLRFGGVFVAYPGDPLRYHSHMIVKALSRDEPVDLLQIVASGRLATAVKKVWLLLSEEPEAPAEEPHPQQNSMKAFSIEWAGFG